MATTRTKKVSRKSDNVKVKTETTASVALKPSTKTSSRKVKRWEDLYNTLRSHDRTLTKKDVQKIVATVKNGGLRKLDQNLGKAGASVRKVVENFLRR